MSKTENKEREVQDAYNEIYDPLLNDLDKDACVALWEMSWIVSQVCKVAVCCRSKESCPRETEDGGDPEMTMDPRRSAK